MVFRSSEDLAKVWLANFLTYSKSAEDLCNIASAIVDKDIGGTDAFERGDSLTG